LDGELKKVSIGTLLMVLGYVAGTYVELHNII
jgi:hypothetical protein